MIWHVVVTPSDGLIFGVFGADLHDMAQKWAERFGGIATLKVQTVNVGTGDRPKCGERVRSEWLASTDLPIAGSSRQRRYIKHGKLPEGK
jgi:hypothetical protein